MIGMLLAESRTTCSKFDFAHESTTAPWQLIVHCGGLASWRGPAGESLVNPRTIKGDIILNYQPPNEWAARGTDDLSGCGATWQTVTKGFSEWPQSAETQKPSFGRVIERVVEDAIDLDSGKTGTTPLSNVDGDKEGLLANIKGIEREGWDIIEDNPETIFGVGMKTVPLAVVQWDTLSPQQMIELIKDAPVQAFVHFSPVQSFPATYAFQTREGGMGLLQITDISESQHGVKIRYKLVKCVAATQGTSGKPTAFKPIPAEAVRLVAELNGLPDSPAFTGKDVTNPEVMKELEAEGEKRVTAIEKLLSGTAAEPLLKQRRELLRRITEHEKTNPTDASDLNQQLANKEQQLEAMIEAAVGRSPEKDDNPQKATIAAATQSKPAGNTPGKQGPATSLPKVVNITLAADGTLTVAGQPCPADQLAERLGKIANEDAVSVIVHADEKVPFQQLTAVFNACTAAGIKQSAIASTGAVDPPLIGTWLFHYADDEQETRIQLSADGHWRWWPPSNGVSSSKDPTQSGSWFIQQQVLVLRIEDSASDKLPTGLAFTYNIRKTSAQAVVLYDIYKKHEITWKRAPASVRASDGR